MQIEFPANTPIVIAKLISALVLHWICLPQIRSSLEQMKFVVNHSYRFSSPFAAYFGGFLHMSAIVTIEMLNMYSLLSVPDLFEFVRDFTALVVIADFENLLALAIKEDCLKLLMENESFKSRCLVVSRTSKFPEPDMRDLVPKVNEAWIDPTDEELKNISQVVLTRTKMEAIGYFFYRLFRVIYVTMWFYFLPLIIFYMMYAIPFFRIHSEDAASSFV